MVQDQEVDLEARHVNEYWENDQACNTSSPMSALIALRQKRYDVWSKACRGYGHTTDIFRSPNFSQRSSIVYKPTNAVTKRPTHLTLNLVVIHIQCKPRVHETHLVTQPIDQPVIASQSHQSGEKELQNTVHDVIDKPS